MIDSSPFRAALDIARTLRAAGHASFFAGGSVRDLLLGLAPKDIDVATSATPEIVQSLFPRTHAVGAHFGVVLVCSEIDSHEIITEVATFRHDGAYSDGRRPDTVRFSRDPSEDVLRRDFTINGMLLDPIAYAETGDATTAVRDFVHSQRDLADKIIRAIGDPALRFAEDKLRMLRAVRFAARLGFSIDPGTFAAIQRQAPSIASVSNERIREELTRMLTEGHARRAFELLDASCLLGEVLPEAVKMHNVQQPPEFHPEGDVWTHTMLLLEQLPPHPSPALAWGALLHDIGKPATYRPPDPKKENDRIRFNGHVEVGVRVAEAILARLRFSNEDTAQIVTLVQNHMRFGDVLQMKQSTLKRFLRLPKFAEHLALHRLDCLSCHGDLTLYNFAKQHFESAPEEHLQPALLLTGRDLIAAGYPPSPQFKTMLEAAEDAQLEDLVHTTGEALQLIRERFGPPPVG
jgi:poly(A) polymerase